MKKYVNVLTLLLPLTAGFLLYFFTVKKPITITPSNLAVNRIGTYTDEVSGGDSKIINFDATEEYISLKYILGSKIEYPYLGFYINTDKKGYINLKAYDRITLKVSTILKGTLGLNLFFAIDKKPPQMKDTTWRFTKPGLDFSKTDSITLMLKDIESPGWWLNYNNIEKFEIPQKKMNKLTAIQIGPDHSIKNQPDTIMLTNITVWSSNTLPAISAIFLAAFLYCFLFIFFARNGFKKRTHFLKDASHLDYKPLKLKNYSDEDMEKIDNFLRNNYHVAELDLKMVSQKIGMSEKKISRLVQQNHTLHFKELLNDIRITEAKRLLKETDRQASDIAFQVGYNNYTHFFRTFKSMSGESPREFRFEKLRST